MSSILISTRKGLFVAEPAGGTYRVTGGHFIGDNVSLAMVDPRGGWYAALDHGHFGVKLHRSDDRGATWRQQNTDYLDGLYNTYGYYFGDITVSPRDANTLYM